MRFVTLYHYVTCPKIPKKLFLTVVSLVVLLLVYSLAPHKSCTSWNQLKKWWVSTYKPIRIWPQSTNQNCRILTTSLKRYLTQASPPYTLLFHSLWWHRDPLIISGQSWIVRILLYADVPWSMDPCGDIQSDHIQGKCDLTFLSVLAGES